MILSNSNNHSLPEFDRKFLESLEEFTVIGEGSLGGKARGLAYIRNVLREKIAYSDFPMIEIKIPRLTVIRTEYFDAFMERNNLYETGYSDLSDDRIAHAFQEADLPVEIVGDLRAIVEEVHQPLAVRSSSMLEDAIYEPFAGIYQTKMIANNQPDVDQRFHRLCEAIKFVYSSVYFKAAKEYFKASSHTIREEKMAVIIQELIGQKHYNRFYPEISGVARSFNYYPSGRAKPEHGVVSLALGLGKSIVDGELVWNYSPEFPKAVPPFADPDDMLKNTQTKFWAVTMTDNHEYNPTKENEYLEHLHLGDADYDGTLTNIASTYSVASSKFVMGTALPGPRLLNFSPLLVLNDYKFNDCIKKLMQVSGETFDTPVEIEFAATFDIETKKMHLGFLQVRPMVINAGSVEISDDELKSEKAFAATDRALGNGIVDNIYDVVFVEPSTFDKRITKEIALEIEELNKNLLASQTPYLLIGFGRWGSSDPWLGIPVEWGQIAGASVIIESTLFAMNVDLSQGSHFFHNLTSFNVKYFSINFDGKYKIDWKWLGEQKLITEKRYVKHVRLEESLTVKVDGRTGKGVILK